MTAQSKGSSNSHREDSPYPSKAAESADIAAQTAEWIKEHGEPELVRNKTTAEILAGVALTYDQNGKPRE